VSRPGPTGRRQRLSVVVLATPESTRLLPTLESVRDWADEVVVLDESPQGAWKGLARRVGVRWFDGSDNLDVAEARRRAFYRTDGEWVLLLVADERLDWRQGGGLLRELVHPDPAPWAWTVAIIDQLDPREPAVPRPAARLVRKRPGLTIGFGDVDPVLLLNDRPLADAATASALVVWRPPAPTPAEPDRAQAALAAWRAGDRLGAMAQLRAVLDAPAGAAPDDAPPAERARVARLLSSLLVAERKLDEAVDRIEAELAAVDPSADPNHAAFLLGELGRAELLADHRTRAAACFDRALQLSPRLYALHAGHAEYFEATGRTVDGIESWLRGAVVRPDLGAPRRRAGELMGQIGRDDDGLALLIQADMLDQSLSLASTWIDRTEEVAEEPPVTNPLAELLKEFQESVPPPASGATAELESPPADEAVVAEAEPPAPAAELPHAELGHHDDEPESEGDARVTAAMVMPVTHDHDDVMPPAEPVLPGHRQLSDPSDPAQLERRHIENAAHFEQELASRPDDHELQLKLGLTWFSLREWGKAEEILRQAVRQTGRALDKTQLAVAWCRLAECSLERADLAEASREAGSALALDPNSAEARLVIGRIAFRQHRFHEAAREFRRLLSLANDALPVDRGVLLREMGIALYRDGRHAESAETLVKAVERLDGDAMLHLFLGNAQARVGRTEAAIEAFRTAHRIDPSLPEARNNLVVLTCELANRWLEDGRHREVLDLVAGAPPTAELIFLSAVARHALGDLPAARRELEALNAMDDSYAEAHWNLAVICRQMGDVAAAGRALARFRHLAPADPRGRTLEEALARDPANSSIP
jgi:tetratricopeptide (TPR) repeat protein